MNLGAYSSRIGVAGSVRPDLETLRRIHRGHVRTIPFENLDVQLGRPLVREPEAVFDKLVTGRRGGWCYEMNGLLRWALGEIGFDVMSVEGAVGFVERGESALANHLTLLVRLDRTYLADVGFGAGPVEPIPLQESLFRQKLFVYQLNRVGRRRWRFHSGVDSGGPSYDFAAAPADEARLDAQAVWQQTSPESGFVRSAVVQRYLPDGHAALRGRVLRRAHGDGSTDQVIGSAREYVRVLRTVFGLDLPEAADLWPRISARHDELFAPETGGLRSTRPS